MQSCDWFKIAKKKTNDINKYYLACVLSNNMGDISRIEKLPYADFWTYSFPCQDISVEEMSDFMANHFPVSFDCPCNLEPLCRDKGKFDDYCVNAFYQWLNSEVKNEIRGEK